MEQSELDLRNYIFSKAETNALVRQLLTARRYHRWSVEETMVRLAAALIDQNESLTQQLVKYISYAPPTPITMTQEEWELLQTDKTAGSIKRG